MIDRYRYKYITQFANLCNDIYPQDLEHVIPRIMDVLPYVFEGEFGHDWDDIRKRVSNLLEVKAFESSIFCLIPINFSINFEKGHVMTFSFGGHCNSGPKKTYRSRSEVFSLGLLGAYLRYLIDNSGLSLAEDYVAHVETSYG